MALYSVIGSDNIPAGAIKVSKEEALNHQKNIIKHWKNESDVFFLKYGKFFATGTTAISSIALIKFFKNLFRITFTWPFCSIYLPLTVIPCVGVNYSFEKKITNNNLLSTIKCPLCTQIRYFCGHLTASIIYPGITSALLLSLVGRIKSTVDVPSFDRETKKFCHYIYEKTKPSALKFQGLIASQVIVILFIQYMQIVEMNKLKKELLKIENSNNDKIELS